VDLDISQPFTRKHALDAGLTDAQLRSVDFFKILVGVFISSRARVTPVIRARAALLIHPPSAILTHSSLARILGAPVPHDPLEHVTVTDRKDRRQRHGLRCHAMPIDESDVRVLNGLRTSCPARNFVEMAGLLSLVDLVVYGDWLVRQNHVGLAELLDYCDRTRLRHARRAREAAAYVRENVDSPMETRLRMLIVLAGLPEPEVNVKIRDENGQVILRADLAYRSVRLAVEYDGRHHVEDPAQAHRDGDRRDEFEEGSWRLLVVRSAGIYREPERTVLRVWRALRARGYQPLPQPTDAWRAHFGR